MSLWEHREPGEIVVLDNRDSFVFNLAHRLWEVGAPCAVVRSDATSLSEIASWRPRALVISPGPGHPDEAGISVDVVRELSGTLPILGVCLGHQAIAAAFGGIVVRDDAPCHGRTSAIVHDESELFAGVPHTFEAGRYHSLAVREPLPEALRVTARTEGLVMALQHNTHPTFGVQFHPESILSPDGYAILGNFVRLAGFREPR